MTAATLEAERVRMPEHIDDLDDVKAWIAHHDGRIDALWDSQKGWNATVERRLDSMMPRDSCGMTMKGYDDALSRLTLSIAQVDRRVTAIERRVMWLSGFAAGFGALAGEFLPRLFGG